MSFSWYKDEEGYYNIVAKEKMPSGMTVEILFELYDLTNIGVANVALNVYKKRKQIPGNVLHQTGKDGIKPFIWALKKINEFGEYYNKEFTSKSPIYIQVYWEDNRRGRIYKRYLPRYGFQLKDFGGGKQLYKRIK